MMISADSQDIADALRRATEQARGLAYLQRAASNDPDLAEALALVDAESVGSRMKPEALQAALDEAQRDLVLYTALAERQRRAEASHTLRIASCACGHSGSRHADRLTDDDRLPCRSDGCRCDDLAFTSEVPAT